MIRALSKTRKLVVILMITDQQAMTILMETPMLETTIQKTIKTIMDHPMETPMEETILMVINLIKITKIQCTIFKQPNFKRNSRGVSVCLEKAQHKQYSLN